MGTCATTEDFNIINIYNMLMLINVNVVDLTKEQEENKKKHNTQRYPNYICIPKIMM